MKSSKLYWFRLASEERERFQNLIRVEFIWTKLIFLLSIIHTDISTYTSVCIVRFQKKLSCYAQQHVFVGSFIILFRTNTKPIRQEHVVATNYNAQNIDSQMFAQQSFWKLLRRSKILINNNFRAPIGLTFSSWTNNYNAALLLFLVLSPNKLRS